MKGRCLCGAVAITTPDNPVMNACHCGMCRRWGSSPYFSVHCGADVEFEGREHITVFRSSEWAERAFCRVCGTHLYYLLLSRKDHEVSVGLFQHGPQFQFSEQIFIDRKPAYYAFANHTVNLTEAEVFAKYSG